MDGSNDKRSPGQPFKPPPAEIWNGMVDAGNAYRASRLNNGTPPPTRPRKTDIVKLKNISGADRAKGEILLIDDKAITDLTDEHIWLLGDEPTAEGYFAILKEPIAADDLGDAQVSGCCLAMVDVSDTDHTRAKAAAGLYMLESSTDGPLEILYSPGTTGEVECVVRFAGGGGGDMLFGFKITTAMSSLSGVGSIYSIDDYTFSTPLLTSQTIRTSVVFGDLPLDTLGSCVKKGGVYVVVVPGCPVEEEYV